MFDPSAEIAFFFVKVSFKMYLTTTNVLIYWASCPRDILGRHVCNHLHQHPEAGITVQKASTLNLMVNRILFFLTMSFFLLLIGVWGDKCGRKSPALLSALGSILAVLVSMLAVIRYDLALVFINIGTFIGAASGMGTPVSLCSYVVDVTSVEDRTYRLAIFHGVHFIGNLCGYIIAASLLQFFGYATVYCVSLGFLVLTVGVILVRLRNDTVRNGDNDLGNVQSESTAIIKKETRPTDTDTKPLSRLATLRIWTRELFQVVCKKRENCGRRVFLTLVVTGLVTHVLNTSKDDIMLLFVKKPGLDWSDAWYGYFVSAKSASNGFFSFVFVPLLSKAASVHDVTFFVLGSVVHGLSSFLAAFSDRSWMVFLSGVSDGPGVMTFTAIQTMTTKVVEPQEVGTVLAIIDSLNSVCQLMAFPVFSVIYRQSVTFFPGLTLALFGVVYLALCGIYIIIGSWLKEKVPAGKDSIVTESTPLTTAKPDLKESTINGISQR